MNSLVHGSDTLNVEVTNISSHGLWLLAHGKEFFLSYEAFNWFQDQPVKALIHVEEVSPGHFYWPEIDVDLTQDMIENPENYPMVSKG